MTSLHVIDEQIADIAYAICYGDLEPGTTELKKLFHQKIAERDEEILSLAKELEFAVDARSRRYIDLEDLTRALRKENTN